ncbi:hypothetical protein PRK78_000980 [Emydomyces testavorans]|uniref:Uncharacterized protein n=1 Tax=Emydomyces testavorans TaxID=2070801 RepID=A0AAF0DCF5_9EURO|nr:hypothetical protein PRK78_000980 [Emydomyces testavorans]
MGKAARSTFAHGRACGVDESANNNANGSMTPAPLHTSSAPPPNHRNQNVGPSQPSKNKDGPRKFEFVLVTDAESRKQVRRYAMQQYVHQRRLDGIARLESNKAKIRGWPMTKRTSEAVLSPAIKDEPESGSDCKISSSSEPSPSPGDFGNFDSLVLDAFPAGEEMGTCDRFRRSPSLDPQAGPSSGTVDPFNSYPLTLKKTDQDLIPHFITRYPLMMYKIGHADPYNPIRAIFHRVAIHDPVPFQAMLAVAAKHRAGVQGQIDTVQSLTHKMRALRLLNERLKNDPWGKQEGTIYSTASMAVIEKWSKDDNVEHMHIRGLTQLLKRRGGMRGMRFATPTSRFMEKVLYWVDFSCAPNAIVGATLPWTGDTPDTLPSLPFMAPRLYPELPIPCNNQDTVDILQACEDFFSFFRSLNELQQSLFQAPLSSNIEMPERRKSPQQSTLFKSDSPLYFILTTLPDYDHGIRDIRYIDEYCCIACLLYLNIALYDYYSTSRNFNDYLEWINREIKRLNQYGAVSIASVLWIFLDNGGFPNAEASDDGERNWFVSRILRVAKRFNRTPSKTVWDYLRFTLLEFLIIHQECGIGANSIGEAELNARRHWRHNKPLIMLEEAELRQTLFVQLCPTPPASDAVCSYPSPATPGE